MANFPCKRILQGWRLLKSPSFLVIGKEAASAGRLHDAEATF